MMLRKRLMVVLLMLMSLSLFAPVASAADQTRITGSFSFTTTSRCIDPIRGDGSYDEVMHTYYDRDGNPIRLSFTGKFAITFTNLTTGATYRPNLSGPGTFDLLTGQEVLRGGNLTVDSNGVLVASDGRMVLDANDSIISFTGQEVGICEKLGSTPLWLSFRTERIKPESSYESILNASRL